MSDGRWAMGDGRWAIVWLNALHLCILCAAVDSYMSDCTCSGETVGELSVLTEASTREVDAVCIRDCELVQISKEAFKRIIHLFPKVMKKFSKLLAKRHQQVLWLYGCLVVWFPMWLSGCTLAADGEAG